LRQLRDWALSHEASIGLDTRRLEERHRYEGWCSERPEPMAIVIIRLVWDRRI
jgi:hypothetical protein